MKKDWNWRALDLLLSTCTRIVWGRSVYCQHAIHIANFTKLWGLLWVYSGFRFENINGHIRKMFHGTQQVLDQLVFSVKAEHALFFKTRNLVNESEASKVFFSKYLRLHQDKNQFKGTSKRVVLPQRIHKAIESFTNRSLTNNHNIVSKLRKKIGDVSSVNTSQKMSVTRQ